MFSISSSPITVEKPVHPIDLHVRAKNIPVFCPLLLRVKFRAGIPSGFRLTVFFTRDTGASQYGNINGY